MSDRLEQCINVLRAEWDKQGEQGMQYAFRQGVLQGLQDIRDELRLIQKDGVTVYCRKQ